MTKTSLKLLVPLLFLIFALPASAFTAQSGEMVKVDQGQVIEGNFYASGSSIAINGTVKGDVICVGQNININALVEGDIICAGQTVNINSQVGGNIRVAGSTVNINSKVARNLMAFGSTVVLASGSEIGWNALVAGSALDLMGKINGTLHGGGEAVTVGATVGKDVNFDAAKITIGDQARIGGNLIYPSHSKEVNISQQAQIVGKTIKKESKDFAKNQTRWQTSVAWVWGKVISLFGSLILGLLLIGLFKNKLSVAIKPMLEKPWSHLGWGVVWLFLLPIAAVIMAITIIGLPLAAIVILGWIIALLLAKVMAGLAVGTWIFEKLKWSKKNMIWSMIIGVVVIYLLCLIPFVGWILSCLALLWGLGSLWQVCRRHCC